VNALLDSALENTEIDTLSKIDDLIEALIPDGRTVKELVRLNAIVEKLSHSRTPRDLWRTLRKQARTASVIDLKRLKSAGS
jgi:hypothetical protein